MIPGTCPGSRDQEAPGLVDRLWNLGMHLRRILMGHGRSGPPATHDQLGLGSLGFMVVHRLLAHGETSPSQLAQVLAVSRPNMTVLLKQLTRDGWLESRQDTQDHRRQIVGISEEGRLRMADHVRIHRRQVDSLLLERLDDAKRQRLVQVLDELDSLLDGLGDSE